MQNLQNSQYDLFTVPYSYPLCFMYILKRFKKKYYTKVFPIQNTIAMIPETFCNLMSCSLFATEKTTRNTTRNVLVLLEN